jgi:hypothetical protein
MMRKNKTLGGSAMKHIIWALLMGLVLVGCATTPPPQVDMAVVGWNGGEVFIK